MENRVLNKSVFLLWWGITWQTMLIGFFVGFAGGMLGVGIALGIGLSGDASNNVASVVSYLAVVCVSFFIIKSCVGKSFGGYKFVLVKDNSEEVIESEKQT
ncbi:hypothetical protein ACV0UQ_004383 [Vibrio vulnificus]